jgi:hypothetical protein
LNGHRLFTTLEPDISRSYLGRRADFRKQSLSPRKIEIHIRWHGLRGTAVGRI